LYLLQVSSIKRNSELSYIFILQIHSLGFRLPPMWLCKNYTFPWKQFEIQHDMHFYSCSGVRMSLRLRSGPIVPASDDGWGNDKWGRGLNTWRKTCPSATVFTTDPIWSAQRLKGLNPGLLRYRDTVSYIYMV
jgi:hypothetical protein